MSRLLRAIQLAAQAHAGQLDKTGQPFIGHPLRVMARAQNESEAIVGVLHDVLEDTNYTVGDLDLTRDECLALDLLTRRVGETYREYITAVSVNRLAVAVKRYDILDNADPARGWDGVPISRYRWAWEYLFPGEPLPRGLEKEEK